MAKAIFGEDTKIDPDSITCDRCRGSLDRHWSGDCKLRICAEERGYRYCFQCDDFICKKLVEFSKTHHGRTVDNMKEMKKIGLYNWLKKQKKKGQAVMCP
jgi:hypothetical protein